MGIQVNNILLWTPLLGWTLTIIFFMFLIFWNYYRNEEKQKTANEKVVELTEKGHDAKICTRCNGKGHGFWSQCSKCGGLGYIQIKQIKRQPFKY